MQTDVETLPEDRVRLTVEVPAHDVDHAFEHALRDLAKDVRIPGFRKGKVPAKIVLARLGPEAVTEEALRTHLGSWYARAVTQARIEPVDQPDIDWSDPPHEGAPFAFTATVQVAPGATLPEDLELEAAREEVEIPEGAVDGELERLRVAAAELAPLPADTPAGPGHFALIDFTGTLDDKVLKDASVTDYSVEVGAGRLVGELELALPGMKVGETKQVDVTFPADYEPRKVAGRTANFDLHLKELKERVLPELDDAFAAQVSEHETLDALRAAIEAEVEKALEQVPRGALPRRGDGGAGRGRDRRRAAVDGRPAGARPPRGPPAAAAAPRRLARRVPARERPHAAAGRRRAAAGGGARGARGARPARLRRPLRHPGERRGARGVHPRRGHADQGGRRPRGRAPHREPGGRRAPRGPRLRAALDHAVAHAKAITPDQAAAREKLWTPGQDAEKAEGGRSALWLPPTAQ